MNIVALGGGHGLYATLSALRGLTEHLTAIVTVADDGGSSGRLREELGVLPPGDLRMALSALCEDTEWGRTWADVLQSRFVTEGPLHGHALGNLLIAALWNTTGDVVEGLDWIGRLLRSEGRVLPLAGEPLEIAAKVVTDAGETVVTGQVAVATAPGRITSLSIDPVTPNVPAETVAAIDAADLVVLGPGSWYTSVLVHFLVSPVAEALVRAQDRTVLVLNIAHEDQETAGTDRTDDVRALRTIAPGYVPAKVLADVGHGEDPRLVAEVAEWGTRLAVAPLRAHGTVDRHDIAALRAQYALAAEQFV
jgi:uncharacterized cofD-like protein